MSCRPIGCRANLRCALRDAETSPAPVRRPPALPVAPARRRRGRAGAPVASRCMTAEDKPNASVARVVLEGFTINHPTAVKVGKLEGPLAERYADLIIHKADLRFAHGCAQVLAQSPPDSQIVRDALYQSAVVAWAKCFASSYAGRF